MHCIYLIRGAKRLNCMHTLEQMLPHSPQSKVKNALVVKPHCDGAKTYRADFP